jgi:hypothetical protein
MAKKHHKYTHTSITHHDDGSHTVKHHHEDGKSHKEYAKHDHDSMIDGLMDHTSAPNAGEDMDAENKPIGGGMPPAAAPAQAA